MSHPDTIDRAAAEARGYRTISADDFELAEFLRYVHGDEDHLYRIPHPPGPALVEGAQSSHVGTGEGKAPP